MKTYRIKEKSIGFVKINGKWQCHHRYIIQRKTWLCWLTIFPKSNSCKKYFKTQLDAMQHIKNINPNKKITQ